MNAVWDHRAHEIVLFRRDGEDHYACTCGARTRVSSTSDQANRAAILKSFARDHLSRVHGERAS